MEEITLYTPHENEEYMNPRQLHYFKTRLLNWQKKLHKAASAARSELKQGKESCADIFDLAANNTDFALGIGDIERNRKSLVQIDQALARIKSGEYGYCDLTGEEIGVKRLSAQPTATLCIEVQEMLERNNQITLNNRRFAYQI